MKRKLSTSLRTILTLSVILTSPGIAAAQVVGAAESAAAGVSGISGAAASSALHVAAPIGAIATPLAPSLSAGFLRAAPATEPGATPMAAAAAPAVTPVTPGDAAPQAATPENAAVTPQQAAVAPEAAAVTPDAARAAAESAAPAPVLRVTAADRIASPMADARAATAPDARGAGLSRLRGLFDGWRGRGAAPQDGAAVAENGAVSAAPSGLSRPTPRAAATRGVPALGSSPVASSIGFAAMFHQVGHWLSPSLISALPPLSFSLSAIADYLGALHPTAIAFAGLMGGYGALKKARQSGAGTGAALSAAGGAVLNSAATAHVALDVTQLAFNGFSIVGLNPLMTAISAVILGRSAFAALSDPTLTAGERVKRVLPAAAAAGLLAAQTVMTLSFAALPQLIMSGMIAAAALAAIAQAKLGGDEKRAASRASLGLIIQAAALAAALIFFAPALAWWLVAASAAGLLLSASGLIRSIRAANDMNARVQSMLRSARPTVPPAEAAAVAPAEPAAVAPVEPAVVAPVEPAAVAPVEPAAVAPVEAAVAPVEPAAATPVAAAARAPAADGAKNRRSGPKSKSPKKNARRSASSKTGKPGRSSNS